MLSFSSVIIVKLYILAVAIMKKAVEDLLFLKSMALGFFLADEVAIAVAIS